jgi:hypothetical protein
MSVLVELHYTGAATIRTEVQAIVEHVLSGRPGEWRVSIVGSRAKEDWEMKVEGPNVFERSYHSRPNWAFENIPTLKTLGIARL